MSGRSKRGKGKGEDADGIGKRPKKRRLSDSDDEESKRGSTASPAVSKSKLTGDVPPNGLKMLGANKPAELFRKDLISAMKVADSEAMYEEYIFISDPWRQEWEKGVQVPVNPDVLPKTSMRITMSLGKTGDFKIPRKQLHATVDENYKQGIHELTGMQQLAEQVCRYDLDDMDVKWLQLFNGKREEMGEPPMLEWTMEKIIEELEHQCHENIEATIKTSEGLGIEYDENVVCDVCRSPDSEDHNEMVFCDSCDICVHQACYGVQKIPDGSWLCRTCALGIKPQCILCPNRGGAMKSTKSGTKWAHVSCALWIPEVSIGDPDKMEPITKISHIPSSRWALVCSLCRERNIGACIQCSVKTCKTAFHVTCAFQNGLEMKTILDENDEDDVKLKAYCSKHSGRKRSSSDSSPPGSPYKVGSPGTPGTPRKELTKQEKENLRAHKIEELKNEFYTVVKVEKVAQALELDEELVSFVFEYWKLKRRARFNKALLMPKMEEEDMLNKQQESSLIARMKMFVHLRQDLERVRNLCYMVSRREKIRRSYYKSREEIFFKQAEVVEGDPRMSNREIQKVIDQGKGETVYDLYFAAAEEQSKRERMTRGSPSSPSSLKENRLSPEKILNRRGMDLHLDEKKDLNGVSLKPASKYLVSEQIKQKVQNKVFRSRKLRPVNGVNDHTQRRLDSYFKPLLKKEDPVQNVNTLQESRTPQSKRFNGHSGNGQKTFLSTRGSPNLRNSGLSDPLNSPETRSTRRRIEMDIDTNSRDRLFENVDNEISICRSSRDTTPDRETRSTTRRPKKAINFRNSEVFREICKKTRTRKSSESDSSDSDSVDVESVSDVSDVSGPTRRVTRSRLGDSGDGR